MRIFKTLLVISFICMSLIVFKLLGTYILLKHEVNEAMAMNKISETLVEKEHYFRDFINWLWISLGYMTLIAIICVRSLAGIKQNRSRSLSV